jgi:hypothetical protein
MAATTDRPTDLSPAARREARAIAAEELTGLALQERGLTLLLGRHAKETPPGPDRDRLERHAERSREHQQTFAALVGELSDSKGPREAFSGTFRSGLAALGTAGAAVGQVVSLPMAVFFSGGKQERLLENAGVEGAAIANKLVILTACTRALTDAGDERALERLDRVRRETQEEWDALLEVTPDLMDALVRARGATA